MKFIQSYYTDIGVKRTTNQDSLALIKAETDFGDVLLACVCDGMGGHSAGELASKYCVQQIADWFRTSFPEAMCQHPSLPCAKDIASRAGTQSRRLPVMTIGILTTIPSTAI